VLDANFVDMNNEYAVCKALSCFRIQGFQRTSFVAPHVDKTNFRLRRGSSSRTWGLGMPVNEADILWVELRTYLDIRALLSTGLDLAGCYFCTKDSSFAIGPVVMRQGPAGRLAGLLEPPSHDPT